MDPTFYRSAAEAIAAPPERLAYVVALSQHGKNAMTVVDVWPESPTYGKVVGWTYVPGEGDEFHHFGWTACSSVLKNEAHSDDPTHRRRRWLIVPGIRSSNIFVFDVGGAYARNPKLVKTIPARTLSDKTGHTRPHTFHCGPDGILTSCLGGAIGDDDGPGGLAKLDRDTFEVVGVWEQDRGPSHFQYDVWWHLNQNVLITSEWGSPSMIENGVVPELLMANKYGHSIHFWDMAGGKHQQELDLGAEHQMALELRPSHDPDATWGFVGVVISTKDLSGSVFLWSRDASGKFTAQKVIEIPAEPCDPDLLPPLLKPFGAVPPIIGDIDLSVDDKWLYVSCWATGELKQYNVSDPAHPIETGSIRVGGIARRQPHPARPDMPLIGGPQMVEISRDGRRLYFTNSLYCAWDDQFYPDGVGAWMVKCDADIESGGLTIDEKFFPHGDDFRGLRVHQVRLEGGDASTDSYCARL